MRGLATIGANPCIYVELYQVCSVKSCTVDSIQYECVLVRVGMSSHETALSALIVTHPVHLSSVLMFFFWRFTYPVVAGYNRCNTVVVFSSDPQDTWGATATSVIRTALRRVLLSCFSCIASVVFVGCVGYSGYSCFSCSNPRIIPVMVRYGTLRYSYCALQYISDQSMCPTYVICEVQNNGIHVIATYRGLRYIIVSHEV